MFSWFGRMRCYITVLILDLKYYGCYFLLKNIVDQIPVSVGYDLWRLLYVILFRVPVFSSRSSDIRKSPKISLVLSIYQDSDIIQLKKLLSSIKKLRYKKRELIVFVRGSERAEFLRRVAPEHANTGKLIVLNEDSSQYSVLDHASGEYIIKLDGVAYLLKDSLCRYVALLDKLGNVDLIYADDEIYDSKSDRVVYPRFKPRFNLTLFENNDYIGCPLIRREVFDNLSPLFNRRCSDNFNKEFSGALDDLESYSVESIPMVLMGIHSNAISPTAWAARLCNSGCGLGSIEHSSAAKAVVEHECNQSESCSVREKPNLDLPKVSIIIPTKNNVELLSKCVDSVLNITSYTNFELVIVDNDSSENICMQYLRRIQRLANVRVIKYSGAFNYSAINNYAIASCSGEYVCFLNDDVSVVSSDWVSEMLRYARRSRCGAVGAKLLYPDLSVQHVGVRLGMGGVAGHPFAGCVSEQPGKTSFFFPVEISAVTAACMMVRKALFESIGGFDEHNLPISFNDVDLCLRLNKAGYKNIWTPAAVLYHYQSATRPKLYSKEYLGIFLREIRYMKSRWRDRLFLDPMYNPNLANSRGRARLSLFPCVREGRSSAISEL